MNGVLTLSVWSLLEGKIRLTELDVKTLLTHLKSKKVGYSDFKFHAMAMTGRWTKDRMQLDTLSQLREDNQNSIVTRHTFKSSDGYMSLE